GEIEVDDQLQSVDVDPAGGDVCGHQYFDGAVFEGFQCLLPCLLRFVAMDGGTAYFCLAELSDNLISPVLSTGKYQYVSVLLVVHQVGEELYLICFHHREDGLLDRLHGGGDRCDGNPLGVVQNRVRQLFDFGWHGGRKQHGLTFLGDFANDGADVFDESHIEHAVCFI